MKLIVGLGNPGTKYEKTRHNVGFMAVEQFLKDFEPVKKTVWENSVKFKSDIVQLEWMSKTHSKRKVILAREERTRPESVRLAQEKSDSGVVSLPRMTENPEKIILVKPKTYMNNSGMAVSLFTTYHKLPTTDLWVIHDDIDLPLGGIKIRFGGGDAGHRGITSIRESLGTDKFWRFRLGIGHPRLKIQEPHQKFSIRNVEDYVVGNFVGGEWGKARELIKHGAKAIEMALENSLESAMNKFNTK